MMRIRDKFLTKDSRERKVQKNILGLAVLQGISVLTSFLLVPLTIDYVSASEYGIWLTISSIIGWFALVDIGLGSGLRNKLAEALAKNDILLAKKYVSTTYFSLGIFAAGVFSILLIVCQFIDWSAVLNQPASMQALLTKTMFVVIAFFAIRLVVQLIGVVLTAHLLPAFATAINTFSNILVLLIIYVLSKSIPGDLYLLAFVLSVVPIAVYVLVSVVLFLGRFRTISPSWEYFEKDEIKSLLHLGFSFFFIKISMIVLFQTSNILIIRFFSNEDVVVYNIAYKLFSVSFMLFEILVQPYWTAFTDAWVKKDIEWIQNSMRQLLKIWQFISLCCVFVLIFTPIIYRIWIGDAVQIPFILSASMCLYFICRCYGGTYNVFINGTGKVKLQSIALLIVVVLYIPMVYLLVKVFNMGLVSIPIALVLTNFYSLFIAKMQYKRLIQNKATGIWSK